MEYKPRLLRETAEIALTEIKRFIEPRLREDFSLRRVSAPLYLPAESRLLSGSAPGARVRLGGAGKEAEIVGSLDLWLRDQLRCNDIAPGFGVFAIMNALRPDLPENRTSSPHVVAWAWQQAVDAVDCNARGVAVMAKEVYSLIVETEKMVLSLFPHLKATLPEEFDEIEEERLESHYPHATHERRMYEYMHPKDDDDDDGKESRRVLLVWRRHEERVASGELWAWNRIVRRPVMLADLGAWGADDIAGCSSGGNIYRHYLGLQILQQDRLMV